MHLISLSLKNYRCHPQLEIQFSKERNLIGGPNEAGKSTLAEAAHRALFMPSKLGGEIQKQMVPADTKETPEVTLTISHQDQEWIIYKKFGGSTGAQTRLTLPDGRHLLDTEAEEKLASILKEDGSVNFRKNAADIWSHLWIWQGSSGEDPSSQANLKREDLIERVQALGLGAAVLSETDQSVSNSISQTIAEHFTNTNQLSENPTPKAGSRWRIAQEKHQTAQEKQTQAQNRFQELQNAIQQNRDAQERIHQAEQALPQLQQELKTVENLLNQATELTTQEQNAQSQLKQSQTTRAQLEKSHQELDQLQQKTTTLDQQLQPQQQQLAQLTQTLETHQNTLNTKEKSSTQSSHQERLSRLTSQLAETHLRQLQTQSDHQKATQTQQKLNTLETQQKEKQQQLSQLPALTSSQLKQLETLQNQAQQAQTSLDAIATGIELIQTDQTVTLDGQTLTPRQTHTLHTDAELHIGTTQLRIRPGGGSTLAQARSQKETTENQLRQLLDQHSLKDLAHAHQIHQERQTLQHQADQLQAEIRGLGGQTQHQTHQQLEQQLQTLNAEIQRQQQTLTQAHQQQNTTEHPAILTNPPTDISQAQQQKQAAQTHAQQLDQTHQDTLSELTAAREILAATRKQKETAQATHQQAQAQLSEHQAHIKLLTQQLGDPETRQEDLAQARVKEAAAAEQLKQIQQKLQTLGHSQAQSDQKRLQDSLTAQTQKRHNAREQLIVSQSQLNHDGSQNPEAELQQATAQLALAKEELQRQRQHALALQLLHKELHTGQTAIGEILSQPIRDRAQPYLRTIFGPETKLRLETDAKGFQTPELIRPNQPDIAFHQLSGGTREQVAAAIRLALAEILADAHGGTLPLIFDDAFAYADPQRSQSLQKMLYHASQQGLQLIILTCTPQDYQAFGATEISLS